MTEPDVDGGEWSEADRARFEASQMLNVLASNSAPDGDLDACRAARDRLLPALDRLMDEPAFSDMHGEARHLLEVVAQVHGAPDLRLDDD